MGARGPSPTPTAILDARGSWRANTRPNEPKAPVSVPKCPKGMADDRRALWRSYGKTLASMGVLTENDATALLLLVNAHSDYVSLDNEVQTRGILLQGRCGEMVKNPAITLRAEAWKRLLRICQEFGLTPAARTRVSSIAASEDTSDLSEFM